MSTQTYSTIYKIIFMIIISFMIMFMNASTLMANDDILIERNRSRDATIDHVYLASPTDTLTVSGYLHKTMNRRGRIPGHMHMNVFGKRDQLLITRTTSYHRHRRKSSYAHFYEQFPISQDAVKKIVVTHHRPGD